MSPERALDGVRVVVTRAKAQAVELSTLLRDRGAQAVEVPAIEVVEPLDGGAALRAAVHDVGAYDWVVLTSPNGAKRFCGELTGPLPQSTQLAAIGTATAAVLGRAGVDTDLIPVRQVAEGLLDVFPEPTGGQGRVLLVRASDARDVFPAGARASGWQLDDVAAYRTIAAQVSSEHRAAVGAAEVVTFTSSSTVRCFVEALGVDDVPPVVACIGPTAAATARELGLSVSVEATDHSLEGLVAALEAHFVS